MKKLLTLAITITLCACNNTVDVKEGANKLVRLHSEPTGCQFLYELDADANFYSEADAVRYLENRIVERSGNAYWLKSNTKRQNEWKMFAPEYSYVMTANVYDCPSLK